MKNGFFKENGKYIGKLLRTHIVVSIFGIMVFLPFNINNGAMQVFLIIGGIIAIILYLFLIDMDMWYLGAEDKLRVDAGRQKRMPLKGLWLGLIAQIPGFVVGALFVGAYYLHEYFSAYESGSFFAGFKVVMTYVNLLWNGMYHGVEYFAFGGWMTWFYLFIPFLPALFGMLTYWLGLINSPLLKPPAREKKQK